MRSRAIFGPPWIRGDVSKPRQLEQALDAYRITEGDYSPIKDYDLLFHFAAEFGRKNGQAYYEDLWTTNCIGTRNVIDECVAREIPLVFSSSSEAYGLSEQYNNGEALREEMLDNYPPQFHNEYALSKYTNERQILTAARNTACARSSCASSTCMGRQNASRRSAASFASSRGRC